MSRIFVNSMSDTFNEEFNTEQILKVFEIINNEPNHQFQILTKRPHRMLALSDQINWTPNIWAGTTVESQKYIDRVEILKKVPANIRFLSCEPLLGPLDLDLTDINWLIAGGESGDNFRPVNIDWIRSLRDQCIQSDTAFFFKQYAGKYPKSLGNKLDGKIWQQFPKS